MRNFDAIAAVETLYRTDLTSTEWLAAVMQCLQPLVDPRNEGLFAGFYDCPDPTSLRPEQVLTLEVGDPMRSLFDAGMSALGPEFVAGTYLSPGIVRNSQVEGWLEIPPVRDGRLRELGFIDNLSIAAVEPDGGGCAVASFHTEKAVLRPYERRLLSGVFRHFVAAHRLHRTLRRRPASPDSADAVLDSKSGLHHAEGTASEPLRREALRRAVREREHARGRRRRDPLGALSAWESLVMDRWTFVDHFESDGRRYILALENAQQPLGLHLLSPREREVVERALQGAHNKAIAYDLGLSHSTIKVLMSRAAFKLGVRTRRELLVKLQIERSRA